MARPNLVWLSLVSLSLIMVAACESATTEPVVQSAAVPQAQRQSAIDCHLSSNRDTALCRKAPRYFRDEQDGGDDPLQAGCHVGYDDAACTANPRNVHGDMCLDRVNLLEMTDTNCHKGDDSKAYDCDAYCKQLGHDAGECRETSEQFCAPRGSAYCKCTGLD